MYDPLLLIAIFFISLISNALNGALSGASSLIGVSLMLLLGIPPHLTMSTYTFGSLPARLSTTAGYKGSGKILWKYVPILAVLGFAASLIGANLLIHTDQQTVINIVSVALIAFIPLAFVKMKKGTERVAVPKKMLIIGLILYFLLAAWTSFFAAWTGILCLFLYLYFFGFTILEIKATESVAGIATAAGATIVYLTSGVFNLWYVAAYIPGAIIGAYVGVKLALHLGNGHLRSLVWLSISAVSIKTILQVKFMQYLQPVLALFH